MEPARSLRFDIQFLRGVAVLLVMLFHAFGQQVPRGYLGVDIFFVVSGYLITLMILKRLESNSFTFIDFYLWRAKRLLPAAYSTFFFTTILAYFFLTSVQWHAYVRQLAGALTFTANIVLERQTGYFEAAAETKPLLHIWSLSLEEQFYFVIPLMLWLVTTRWRPVAIGIVAALSFGLCLAAASRAGWQSFAFYMLPTRAWELLAGSLVAWLRIRGMARVPAWGGWLSLAIIGVTCLRGFDEAHPRVDALLCVLATALIVASADDDWLTRNRLTRSLASLGDWSYSVYLVHWPLFSFAFLAFLGEPPRWLLFGLAAASILLGWLQYRYVETRFRKAWPHSSWRMWTALAAGSAAVVLVALPRAAPASSEGFSAIFHPVRGLDGCDGESREGSISAGCLTSPAPQVALWGDSNAMHLVPGLAADPAIRASLVQITRSACAPVEGMSQIRREWSPDWARQCTEFNRRAVERIIDTPSLRAVVIGSEFFQLFVPKRQRLFIDGAVHPWQDAAAARVARTVRNFHLSGRTPLLVGPIPWPPFDPGECNLRKQEEVALLGRKDCDFALADASSDYFEVTRKLRAIAKETGAPLYLPEAILCPNGRCRTAIDGHLVYRDKGHLTAWGSRYAIDRMGVRAGIRAAIGRMPAAPSERG